MKRLVECLERLIKVTNWPLENNFLLIFVLLRNDWIYFYTSIHYCFFKTILTGKENKERWEAPVVNRAKRWVHQQSCLLNRTLRVTLLATSLYHSWNIAEKATAGCTPSRQSRKEKHIFFSTCLYCFASEYM